MVDTRSYVLNFPFSERCIPVMLSKPQNHNCICGEETIAGQTHLPVTCQGCKSLLDKMRRVQHCEKCKFSLCLPCVSLDQNQGSDGKRRKLTILTGPDDTEEAGVTQIDATSQDVTQEAGVSQIDATSQAESAQAVMVCATTPTGEEVAQTASVANAVTAAPCDATVGVANPCARLADSVNAESASGAYGELSAAAGSRDADNGSAVEAASTQSATVNAPKASSHSSSSAKVRTETHLPSAVANGCYATGPCASSADSDNTDKASGVRVGLAAVAAVSREADSESDGESEAVSGCWKTIVVLAERSISQQQQINAQAELVAQLQATCNEVRDRTDRLERKDSVVVGGTGKLSMHAAKTKFHQMAYELNVFIDDIKGRDKVYIVHFTSLTEMRKFEAATAVLRTHFGKHAWCRQNRIKTDEKRHAGFGLIKASLIAKRWAKADNEFYVKQNSLYCRNYLVATWDGTKAVIEPKWRH